MRDEGCCYAGALRIRRIMETDADAVVELAESSVARSRLGARATGGSDSPTLSYCATCLLLVAVTATNRPVGFIQANRI